MTPKLRYGCNPLGSMLYWVRQHKYKYHPFTDDMCGGCIETFHGYQHRHMIHLDFIDHYSEVHILIVEIDTPNKTRMFDYGMCNLIEPA